MEIYTIQPGDSLYEIARAFGVPLQDLVDANALNPDDMLVVGQTLVIPTDNVRHTVSSGETLHSISRRYGVTVSQLLDANPEITDPGRISVGQVLVIPKGMHKLGTIDVNGYAFPTINSETLERTLPNLTYVSIFSYQVQPDGTLRDIDDASIIDQSRAQQVAPLMVITNIKEGGGFDSDLASRILNDESLQNRLLQNVLQTMQAKNYYGLNVDFEYIYKKDRQAYVDFIRKAAFLLRPLGYTVSVALAPKTSAEQPGLLYGGHDYAGMGGLVDHVILMTYEWGYTYGPPMAVAPIDQVERVLQYAVSVIPSRKILMGIPNYGYDWTLPFEKGSAARAISNVGAVKLAAKVNAGIQYDDKTQSPYFTYYDSDKKEHQVWFEDARSIQAKLLLVDKYKLGGVSYWTINQFFPQNWLVLNSMYDVRKVL